MADNIQIEGIDFFFQKSLNHCKKLENVYLTLSQQLNRILHNHFSVGYENYVIIKVDACMGY